jgi:hypothetical protein
MPAGSYEQPMLCVLDAHDRDRLLEQLRAIHGAARTDIAPELLAAARPTQARPPSHTQGAGKIHGLEDIRRKRSVGMKGTPTNRIATNGSLLREDFRIIRAPPTFTA